LDYLVTRYDSSLNPDSQFNDVETDFPEPSSGDDVAYGVREMGDGSIVVGGESIDSNENQVMSAARYIVPTPPPPTGQIPDIEEYVSDTDLQNPPPGSELAGFLDRLSPTALEIVQGEPSDNGYATINTGDGNDKVLITTVPGSANADIVAVNVNGVVTYYDDQTTHHFYLNTNGGNDTVQAENEVNNFNLYVNAGDGNDSVVSDGDESVIQGGAGNDYLALGTDAGVLVGGSGNDTLKGNNHYDVLIGGTGKDSMSGGSGEDIMIGGTTAYDTDQVALRAILDEWRSGNSRTSRINSLINGGGINGTYVLRGKGLSGQTVFDDAAVDTLDGGADADWFFRHTGSNADILKNSSGDRIDSV
jgi:Ca2+-binding RTX toxin-like protein